MLEGGRRAGVLALLALLSFASLLSCERPEPSDTPWSEDRRIEELEAIGYAAGTNEPRSEVVVTVIDADRIAPGPNLYTAGHEAAAHLIDATGRVLHRWALDFDDAFPEYPHFDMHRGNPLRWRRVRVFPNGDLLAVYEGLGIVRIDASSRVLWASGVGAHHDFDVAPNGDILVLTRRLEERPGWGDGEAVLLDSLTILSPEGREKRRIPLLDAILRSPLTGLLSGAKRSGDVLHTNTVRILDGRLAERDPAFAKGNVLLSILYLDALAVLDVESESLVWALRGSFKRQHDPRILENGRMLLFDNRGTPGVSRVLEFDPLAPGDPTSDALDWEYAGSPARPFYSKWCGTAQRLSNGNTLVTESDDGRAFELTPEREIVWEFYNPQRVGAEYEKIATLFELQRLPADFPVDWARPPGS